MVCFRHEFTNYHGDLKYGIGFGLVGCLEYLVEYAVRADIFT